MPPRRIQRQGDDEHPASKAAAQKQQQKKKPAQPQKKPNKPPARRPAHAPIVSPAAEVEEAQSPEPAPVPEPGRKEAPAVPVRKSKRQQREEEELAALAAAAAAQVASSEDDGEDDSDAAEPSIAPSTSAFASLQLESVENDDAQPKKNKKKKKKRATDVKVSSGEGVATPISERQADTPDLDGADHPLISKKKPKPKPTPYVPVASSSTPPPKPKPKSTEKKKKSRKNKDDEFEAALAELISRSGASGSAAPGIIHAAPVDSKAHKFCDLLSVSLKDLDAATELKKFFGARVVAAAQSSSPGPSRKSAKGVLVQPQAGWPPAGARTGIALAQRPAEKSDDELRRGERWWQVVFDEGYVADTFRFVEAVKTMDPQNLVDLLYRAPWQADTLLQVSEYYRHRDEHQPASELVERAIFAYERALAPSAARFASGRDRLDFRQAESRALFLALARHVVNLVRRGVARSAFETARFLLALDPWTDPQGVLLHLDFLAPKAGQKDWLLRTWDIWPRLRRLPGFWYARVLCLDKEAERQSAMREAVQMFPEVLPLLADKADVVLPGDILTLPAFRVAIAPTADRTQSLVYLLAHVYADRSADLWKDPRNAALLTSVVHSGAPSLAPERAKLQYGDAEEESAFRHVAQFEAKRAWQAFVPARVRAHIGYAWDPLPPAGDDATRYDKHFFRGVQVRGADFDRATVLAQLRGLWAQVPQLADMFPDPARFVDMLQEAPEDAMHLLAHARERAEQAAALDDEPHPLRDVEVQFVEGDEEESEDDGSGEEEEDSEEEEEEAPRDARPFAIRLMQGLFGRFAPRAEEAGGSEDDSEDDGEDAALLAGQRGHPADVD